MPKKEKPILEQLPTAIPGDIPPVPKLETEPTAERIKTPTYSSKKEIEKLKKEFNDYKKIVERDFTEIDESLEENFSKLYKAVGKTAQKVTKKSELTKIESSLDRMVKSVNKLDVPTFKSVLSVARRTISKDLQETIDPKQVAVAKYVASDFEDKRKSKSTDTLKLVSEKLKGGDELSIKDIGTTKSKTKKTATKVSGGMDVEYEKMTKILSDMYTFMKKNIEDDTRQKELEKDFEQSKKEDREKKHKQLIDAIKSIGFTSEQEEIQKETGGGIADFVKSIVDAFAGMETLMTIGAFLSSPAGLASLAILAGAGLAAFVGQKLQNLLEDKEEKSDFEKGGQKAVDAKKRMKAQYNALDESGIITENNEEFQSARSDYDAAVKEKKKALTSPVSSGSNTSSTPLPSSSSGSGSPAATSFKSPASNSSSNSLASPVPVSTPSAIPSPSPNKSAELNSKVSENQDMKLAQNAPVESKVINNTSTNSISSGQSDRVPIPPVRSKEDTFGRLTMYNTRTV